MGKYTKLITAICNNPKTVRFDEACKVAESLGFTYSGGKGSHRVFKRRGETTQLNFQNRQGYILPYQAKQLRQMIAKYGEPE